MSQGPTPQTVRLADYRAPDYRVETADLTFRLIPDRTIVRARLHMARATAIPVGELLLHGEGLELLDVRIDGVPAAADAYRQTAEGLVLIRPPERFTLETAVRIDPAANTKLMGLYVSNGVFCTQCEAQGFRRITYFLDRPDVLARYRVRLEAPLATAPVLLSNGNPVSSGSFGDGWHFATWEDPYPKPAYLFALVAGDLAVLEDGFRTASGRHVDLRIYSEAAFIDQCAHAMDSLKRAMAWDEARFGLEYDLDVYNIVAVSDFNMGAMENKGLNVFNTAATLARRDTSTDHDFVNVERIIAHEYFHNWTGNRVTCRDWFQLTLKEGLTVFRDQEFTADHHDRDVKRIGDVALLREGQFPEDAGPLAHPIRPDSYVEINNFYTRTVYEKGAEVIRMIHTLIGESAFRRGMDLYFQRHDGKAVTCEDFVAAMSNASGRDFGDFFRWYRQAGTPRLAVRGHYDQEARTYTLDIEQTTPPTPGQPMKEPFHVPIRMGLIDAVGEAVPLRLRGENAPAGTDRVLELTDHKSRFVFEDVDSPPVPSLLRGYSAPVKLEVGFGGDELAHLLAHDTDGFARWDAGQTLALRTLLHLVEQYQSGVPLVLPSRLVEAFGTVLGDPTIQPAFKSQLLGLPSAVYLGEQMAQIDVDAIAAAREAAQRALGKSLAASWSATMAELADETFSLDSAAMGRRRLRNTCLAYLAHGDPDRIRPDAVQQAVGADNMTDQLAALAIVARRDWPERAPTLGAFFERWKAEPLVVNKWFAVQAMAERATAVEEVQGLLDHPAFSLGNPNRVRSVVGVFATGNPRGFHRDDGAGYRLVADMVLELDRRNPQVAARLATAFNRWRRYDPGRQHLQRAELQRIGAVEGLSRDVFEIVNKSLDDAPANAAS
ncbi:MAG: aminopeptidase N [Pseudomonadota bacterium]